MSSGKKAGEVSRILGAGAIGNRRGDGAMGHKVASGGNDGCAVEAQRGRLSVGLLAH
jgi:hypothetical protein